MNPKVKLFFSEGHLLRLPFLLLDRVRTDPPTPSSFYRSRNTGDVRETEDLTHDDENPGTRRGGRTRNLDLGHVEWKIRPGLPSVKPKSDLKVFLSVPSTRHSLQPHNPLSSWGGVVTKTPEAQRVNAIVNSFH